MGGGEGGDTTSRREVIIIMFKSWTRSNGISRNFFGVRSGFVLPAHWQRYAVVSSARDTNSNVGNETVPRLGSHDLRFVLTVRNEKTRKPLVIARNSRNSSATTAKRSNERETRRNRVRLKNVSPDRCPPSYWKSFARLSVLPNRYIIDIRQCDSPKI